MKVLFSRLAWRKSIQTNGWEPEIARTHLSAGEVIIGLSVHCHMYVCVCIANIIRIAVDVSCKTNNASTGIQLWSRALSILISNHLPSLTTPTLTSIDDNWQDLSETRYQMI